VSAVEERASVRTWLYQVATRRCLNALRSRRRKSAASPPPGMDPPEPRVVSQPAERRYRLVATRANGQPAFGLCNRDPRARLAHANGLLVLALSGGRVSAITRFEAGVLPRFGLPRTLPD
jgi:hypothetical protein